MGRLLIPLLLCAESVLREPLLYLSLFFKSRRAEYYDLLDSVRVDGDWEAWLAFFVEGVRETAEMAVTTARKLEEFATDDRATIQRLGRSAGSALQVHKALQRRPAATIARLANETGLSVPTVTLALKTLQENGIISEVTGRRRSRVFIYSHYLDLLR
jgi:Fic family protein